MVDPSSTGSWQSSVTESSACSRLIKAVSHMPIFYFHLHYANRLSKDGLGSECKNLPEAKREARLTARDILLEAIKFQYRRVPAAVVVANEKGRTLHTLPLAAVLPEPLKRSSD